MSKRTQNNSDMEKEKFVIEKAPQQTDARSCCTYDSILYNICQEEGLKLEFLSHNWVKKLTKGAEIHYIAGYKFDLNSQAASLVADDKTATSEALSSAVLPVVEHAVLYRFSNQADYAFGHNTADFAESFFVKHGEDIVIKPNRGSGGKQTFRVTETQQIMPVLLDLFYNNTAVALCPFYQVQHEYRTIILDGEVKLFYRKNLTQSGENWKFNLCQGARAETLTEKGFPEIINLAKAAVQVLGLRFCSIDIIETEAGEIRILEVNSGVMTQHYLAQHPEEYETIKNMYREAVRKMFGIN